MSCDDFYPPLPLNPGDVYTLPFEDGQMHVIEIVSVECDGFITLAKVDNSQEIIEIATDHLQQRAKAARDEILI